MDIATRKKELSRVNLELERLLTIDKKLIEKRKMFIDKLNLAVEKKKITHGVSKEKLNDFNIKYYEHRLKVGTKRMEYYDKKLELIGKSKVVRVNDSDLDAMMGGI